MGLFQALSEIERKITALADCGYGNPYGELGESYELVEKIATGVRWEQLVEWVKEQQFDQEEYEEDGE